ncbi:MAG: hypothetical protein IME94_09315 [Proteobacteria bacterium]|nr:hypothetical protein [Pseudomonadota bacterium]
MKQVKSIYKILFLLLLVWLPGCSKLILPEDQFTVMDHMSDGLPDFDNITQGSHVVNVIPEVIPPISIYDFSAKKRIDYSISQFKILGSAIDTPVKNAKLLATLNSIDSGEPKHRRFEVFIYKSAGNQLFEEIKKESVYIGGLELMAPDVLDVEIEITDILNKFIKNNHEYLGVKIVPVGPVPLTRIDVYAIKVM